MFGKIVVIDDSLFFLDRMCSFLKAALPDYETHTVKVEDAYPSDLPGIVDVFLVDYKMGKMRGPAVIREIRKSYPNVCIIEWTSRVISEQMRAESIDAGADAVVPKDIKMKQLAALVKSLLGEKSAQGGRP